MKIIVGLGNPDKKYQFTRHNLGWLCLDALAQKYNLSWQEKKDWRALVASVNKLFLVKPLTYMNNSGLAVRMILDYYHCLPAENLADTLTVIHDDLDLPLGKYKISVDSSAAGHHGVESIIGSLGTQNFTRVRIGIKTAELEKIPSDKFVMRKMPKEELANVDKILPQILTLM